MALSHVTVIGSKSQASGCPRGLFQPDVLHLKTGCWSCVGPLTAIHCNFLTMSEFVICGEKKNMRTLVNSFLIVAAFWDGLHVRHKHKRISNIPCHSDLVIPVSWVPRTQIPSDMGTPFQNGFRVLCIPRYPPHVPKSLVIWVPLKHGNRISRQI